MAPEPREPGGAARMPAAIRAVFFDFDGTLCTFETTGTAARLTAHWLAAQAGLEAPDGDRLFDCIRNATGRAFGRYANQPFYLYRDLFAEAYREGLLQAAIPATDAGIVGALREFERLAAASFSLREGAISTLAELRRRGLTLGIISNSDDRTLLERTVIAGLVPQVDFVLSSEAAMSCKPDPGIFREALRRAGCAAAEALFVGDTPDQDIVGGALAGLHTALLVPDERLDLPLPRGEAQPEFIIHEIADVLTLLDRTGERRSNR